ncbi:MAG TPA: 50S ribosomal protein L1 [bacterium]|nr:50S ribosomal protein L1 [bacterium]
MKKSKRYRVLLEKIEKDKIYDIDEAIGLLKELHSVKFDETVELSGKLGIDVKKLQQPIRGSVVLPHGTGKKVKVLVFAQGENIEKAKKAGADYVGGQEYIDKIKNGWLDFDAVVSTPDMMRHVATLGKILGPRGLMPSPKTGTVTFEVEKVINELKKGRVDFKVDREGNIHLPVGKISFPAEKLKENIITAVNALLNAKPQGAKGTYIRSLYLSLTMSPSIPLNVNKVLQLAKGM